MKSGKISRQGVN